MRTAGGLIRCCTLIHLSTLEQDSLFKRNAIYLSFEKFRNNTPSISVQNLTLEETDKYRRSIDGDSYEPETVRKYLRSIWGFLTKCTFKSGMVAASGW